jgi:hypothetical protein
MKRSRSNKFKFFSPRPPPPCEHTAKQQITRLVSHQGSLLPPIRSVYLLKDPCGLHCMFTNITHYFSTERFLGLQSSRQHTNMDQSLLRTGAHNPSL